LFFLTLIVSLIRDNEIKEAVERRAVEQAEIAKSIALKVADAVGADVSQYETTNSEETVATEEQVSDRPLIGGVMANNRPGYYLLNNNKYSTNGIPYEKVSDLITQSRNHDIYHQHAHVTQDELNKQVYFGKARLPLYFEPVYEFK